MKDSKKTLRDKLQIILITYNRRKYLARTFEQIFAENSPVRDFDITVLDNCSTDGTSELIEEYRGRFPHLKHIRHNRNIGGNANICRAFEMASREYLWVLCDDDSYDWSNWVEIQEALMSYRFDMVYVCTLIARQLKKEIPQLLFLASFVPGVIYRTSSITDTVMFNMYGCINTWFPQSVLSIGILVNNQGGYFIPKKDIIIRKTEEDMSGGVLLRGSHHEYIHPDLDRIFWHIGYMKVLKIVKDLRKRRDLSVKVRFNERFDKSSVSYLRSILEYNRIYKKFNVDNIYEMILAVPLIFKFYILFYIIGTFFKTCLFMNLRNIRGNTWPEEIFSLKKDKSGKKMFTILGMRWEF